MAKSNLLPRQSTIVIDVDADPHNANWIRILEQQRLAQQPQPQPPTPEEAAPQPQEMPNMAETTDKPWDGSASRWPDAASYAKSCLINLNEGPSANWSKGNCKLPVREPDGTVNRNAVHAAAAALVGGRGGVDAPSAAKKTAARALVRLYGQLNETAPDSIKRMAM